MSDSSVPHPTPKADAAASVPSGSVTQPMIEGATDPPPVANPLTIPGYKFLVELGRGGMGVVYRARDVRADRDVAIKVILSAGHASANDLARFQTEARAVAAVQHPGIVTLFVAGEHAGCPFLVMEFCPGGSLRDALDRGVMNPTDAAALVADLADAVQAAHDRQVVHRDLKPANVLLTADGRPKITDFGLAKRLGGTSDLTASNAVLGTPSYMSPEQAAGMIRAVSPATDIYSLGAILYETLTGVPPFRGVTAASILHRIVNDEPVPPSRLEPGVPRALDAVCLTCLAKKPASRYASAAALAADLRRFCAGDAVPAVSPPGGIGRRLAWAGRHRGLVAGTAIGLAVGVAAVFLLRPSAPTTDPPVPPATPPAIVPNATAVGGPTTIVDDKFGIRLTVPNKWVRVNPEGFNIGSNVYYAWKGPRSSYLMLAVREGVDPDDPRQMLDWMVEKKTTTAGATVLAQEVRTVADMRAAWLVYKRKGTGGAADGVGETDLIDHWVIVPRLDNTTVVFMLTCAAEAYDGLRPSLESVLATLRLSGSQTKQQSESR